MRCPKCGYISFDHLEICLKCNKDVSKTASQVEGTTYHVEAPSFLRVTQSGDTGIDEDTEILFENGQEDFNVVDPDLDILVDAEEVDIDEIGIPLDDDLASLDVIAGEEDYDVAMADDAGDEEAGLDLVQFEDAFDVEESAFEEDEVQLDMPDELNDISDLSPSPTESQVEAIDLDGPIGKAINEEPAIGGPEPDDFSFNLDLDEAGDEFSLSTPGEVGQKGTGDIDLDSLSLDDIGLSEPEESSTKAKTAPQDGMDMDGDLDFDLDLGGLSLTDD